MKNRFRFTILLLTCCLLLSQGAMTAFAETEGSAEGGANVTRSDEMSMDNTLSSLKIAQATLSPEFSPNQLTYTAAVPYEVERVALTAQTSSPEARKVIRGTSDLEVGENVITVTVTAESGSVREYRITLIRQEMPETTPSENDETQEMTPEETVPEETIPEETIPEETTADETVMIPQETKPNGGMMVETTEDASWDLNSLLLNPMFMIGLVGAIVLVILIIIIVAVITLFSRGKEDEDEDEEENDPNEKKETVVLDWDDDFDDAFDEVENLSQGTEVEEDLDDDFEMLLEDDDDFDFLDF